MSETILVTGAQLALVTDCRRLVADGYRVIGSARRIEKLQALRKSWGEAFIPCKMMQMRIFLRWIMHLPVCQSLGEWMLGQ